MLFPDFEGWAKIKVPRHGDFLGTIERDSKLVTDFLSLPYLCLCLSLLPTKSDVISFIPVV